MKKSIYEQNVCNSDLFMQSAWPQAVILITNGVLAGIYEDNVMVTIVW